MRRSALTVLALTTATALAACGDDRSSGPAATSAAVSTPPAEASPQVAPEAAATPAQQAAPSEGLQGGTEDWRKVADPADASLLGRLDQAWRLARAEAEEGGFATKVEALGQLADPNAGQAGRVQPGPGTYRCRTIKMGRRVEGQGQAYLEYPWSACSVELTPGGDLILTKTTGSQRTRGLIYPDGERRAVYVGVQAWGDERHFPAYGRNAERDQVGVIERIGQNRWRLAIPWPKQEAKLELLEIAA